MLKIAVIVESNWQSIIVWEVDGRNLLRGAIQQSEGGGVEDNMVVGPGIGGGWASDVWSVSSLMEFRIFKIIKSSPGFRIWIFF